MERDWTDREGRSWTIRREDDTLAFSRGGRSHSVTTGRAGDLESMEDEELHEMFEDALSADRDEEAPETPQAPSAMGHQSSPHVDPAGPGPEGSESGGSEPGKANRKESQGGGAGRG